MSANDLAFPLIDHGIGLTKREWFAAMAMQGLLSSPEPRFDVHARQDTVAGCAVGLADALLAELEKAK